MQDAEIAESGAMHYDGKRELFNIKRLCRTLASEDSKRREEIEESFTKTSN